MKIWVSEDWDKIKNGYPGKIETDKMLEKNMDAFVGDVSKEAYLPRYSAHEDSKDYTERLERSKISYFNWVKKIITIYKNAIFRTSLPIRETNNSALERFIGDCTGGRVNIQDFIINRAFLMNQLGGCLIIVDKPKNPFATPTISRLQQEEAGLFPYAYIVYWNKLVNYAVDKYGNLKWILLDNGKVNNENTFKLWDREDWAVLKNDQAVVESGTHGLGIVPVVRCMGDTNPKYDFNVPLSPILDIVNISLKIFNLVSQLDQAIVYHIFLKMVMPESMYKAMEASGTGQTNILVFKDGETENPAYYIATPTMEIETMIDLIFNQYPAMILELATVKDKTDRPREESGNAKEADSVDEKALLSEKASIMERTETEMIALAGTWEGVDNVYDEFTVQYSKDFDFKSLAERLDEMVKMFKQLDGSAPTFSKELFKRVMRKALGNVDKSTWAMIEQDLDNGPDPSLDLDDIDKLIERGLFDFLRYTRMINKDLVNASDDEVREFIKKNVEFMTRNTTVSNTVNMGVDNAA